MQPAKISDLNTVAQTVLMAVLALVGIASLVMLLVGGFQFLTAAADKDSAQKAARTLTYAIAGLVLTLSAWIILKFLGDFLGLDFSNFTICLPGQVC